MPRPKHLSSGKHLLLPPTRASGAPKELDQILEEVDEILPRSRKRSASSDAASKWKDQLNESRTRIESDNEHSTTSNEESELSAGEKKDMDHAENPKKRVKKSPKKKPSHPRPLPSSSSVSSIPRPVAPKKVQQESDETSRESTEKPKKQRIVQIESPPAAQPKETSTKPAADQPKKQKKPPKPLKASSRKKRTKKTKATGDGKTFAFARNIPPRASWTALSEERQLELLDAFTNALS